MEKWRYHSGVQVVLKTLFYTGVVLLLLYFYHFKQSGGGTFIYNEF